MFEPKVICQNKMFKLALVGTMSMTSYPYLLEVFDFADECWKTVFYMSPGDLADLIHLIKQYTEEK